MLAIKYKINKADIELLSKMSNSEIKNYDFIEGNLIFIVSGKIYDISDLNPDALLSWLNFLPIDDNDIKEGYKEDIWGTGYWMVYGKEGFFEIILNDKPIFKIRIAPSELVNSFKELCLDLKGQLIKINPAFKNNNFIKEIEDSYNL